MGDREHARATWDAEALDVAVPDAEGPGDAAAAAAVGGTGPAWERESLGRSVDGQSQDAAERAHEPTPVLAAREEAARGHEAGMAGSGDGGETGLGGEEAAAAAAAVAGDWKQHEEREKDEEESDEVTEEESDDEDAAT
ncbi:uncharacterized protein Triagg1_1842 [Trichoderma aggressivum f. europaeum]|uniref:Uncharacterized protein n=1 Tax=Trichoderma aggressivum f. europaeum TaxID=173218 RepID=A0AAE1M8R9_9HYPO|nr:hypothetical protein Triagg1_1842 [Trichoderma aggressivum f. europaeum]